MGYIILALLPIAISVALLYLVGQLTVDHYFRKLEEYELIREARQAKQQEEAQAQARAGGQQAGGRRQGFGPEGLYRE